MTVISFSIPSEEYFGAFLLFPFFFLFWDSNSEFLLLPLELGRKRTFSSLTLLVIHFLFPSLKHLRRKKKLSFFLKRKRRRRNSSTESFFAQKGRRRRGGETMETFGRKCAKPKSATLLFILVVLQQPLHLCRV